MAEAECGEVGQVTLTLNLGVEWRAVCICGGSVVSLLAVLVSCCRAGRSNVGEPFYEAVKDVTAGASITSSTRRR